MPRITHPTRALRKKKMAQRFRSRRGRKPQRPRLIEEPIDYKNIALLRTFLNLRWALKPRRQTRLSRSQHAEVVLAVKRARSLALLPYHQHHEAYGLNFLPRR